jgi:NTP pyrophosphatase (non-canonical NTP hydrolase)
MNDLIYKILTWANDRNIIKGGTSKDQCLKLMQEVGELSDSLCKGESPIDDIGDCMVVLAIIARQHGLTVTECLEHAYNDIKDRRGVMQGGVFIKEES